MQKHMEKFHRIIADVEEKFGEGKADLSSEIETNFNNAMDDDFNTARAIADLFGYFKKIQEKLSKGDKSAANDVATIKKVFGLLGLFVNPSKEFLTFKGKTEDIPQNVKEFAKRRWAAKQNRNWAEADALRAKIDELGYAVKDSKDGYEIIKK